MEIRKKLHIPLLFIIMLAPTCPDKKEINKESANLLLYLEESPCYGKCPVYRVWVMSNGTIYWEGKMFVKKEGYGVYKMSKEELARIHVFLKRFKWKKLDTNYVNWNVSDVPSWILHVRHKRITKTIYIRGPHVKLPKELADSVYSLQEFLINLNYETIDSLPSYLPEFKFIGRDNTNEPKQ